jgi:hypothetical protein
VYLVTTTGDSVNLVTTKAQLDAVLAPYDTEQAAVLAAASFGLFENVLGIDCTDKTKGAVRSIDGGYEVVGVTYECSENWSVTQHLLFVAPDGTVTERSRYTLASGTVGAGQGCLV